MQVGDKWGCTADEVIDRMTVRQAAELQEEYRLQNPKKGQQRPVPAGLKGKIPRPPMRPKRS